MSVARSGGRALDPAATWSADERLLRDFLAGAPAAVRRIERWAWEIAHFRWQSLGVEECEDVVQETLAGLLEACRRPGFELRASLRALVRRIAAARCIDRARRRRAHTELPENLADPAPGPHEAWQRLDRGARLRWVLHELPALCRELLRLRFVDEQPYAEIARATGRAETTLRVHVFNCLKAVRQRWEREPA